MKDKQIVLMTPTRWMSKQKKVNRLNESIKRIGVNGLLRADRGVRQNKANATWNCHHLDKDG